MTHQQFEPEHPVQCHGGPLDGLNLEGGSETIPLKYFVFRRHSGDRFAARYECTEGGLKFVGYIDYEEWDRNWGKEGAS